MNAGVAIAGAIIAIFVGVIWSREVLSRGIFGFDMGYLPVALGVSWGLAASVDGTSLNLRARLRLFAPLIPVFVFEALADYSLTRLHSNMSVGWLLSFGSFSILMLLTALILVTKFNYPSAFGPFSVKRLRSWRKLTVFTAAGLGILVVGGPARILMELRTVPFSSVNTLHASLVELESWFYKSSLLVYLFIIVRVLFPSVESEVFDIGYSD